MGDKFTRETAEGLAAAGLDAFGEGGEFHTEVCARACVCVSVCVCVCGCGCVCGCICVCLGVFGRVWACGARAGVCGVEMARDSGRAERPRVDCVYPSLLVDGSTRPGASS